MAKRFGLVFGSGDARSYAGLSPTFVIFQDQAGNALTPPGITAVGVSTGFYYFEYSPSPTLTVFFQADGGSSITDSSFRYIKGTLDPIQSVDERLGYSTDSIGGTLSPTTAFGLILRNLGYFEADENFNKSSGAWNRYATGTSTLLISKTVQNLTGQVIKS